MKDLPQWQKKRDWSFEDGSDDIAMSPIPGESDVAEVEAHGPCRGKGELHAGWIMRWTVEER
jgi:hypothetical protein